MRIVAQMTGPERHVLASDEGGPPPEPRPRTVYTAELLNQPHNLTSIRRGDAVRFYADAGCEHPLMVTQEYLAARGEWWNRAVPRVRTVRGARPATGHGRHSVPGRRRDAVRVQLALRAVRRHAAAALRRPALIGLASAHRSRSATRAAL